MLPPPYYNDDKNSFAYSTVHKRWPTIIQGAIDDVQETIASNKEQLQDSGSIILDQLKQVLSDMEHDAKVRQFTPNEISINSHLSHFNKSLEKFNRNKLVTWQTGPWLYLECYLYQLINNFFIDKKQDKFWQSYDVFQKLKTKTFKQSEFGVFELCKRYETLSHQLNQVTADSETLYLLFAEFIDISLWGNATDLSLLAGNVTLEDIKSLQGAEVRQKNEEKIIVNDLKQAWEKSGLSSKGAERRIDIVLDNSGFELFADLILCLFLLDSQLASEIHLHCKEIPWFVSDTMPKDFRDLLDQLKDGQFFPKIHKQDSSAIQLIHDQIAKYNKENKIIIDHSPFWTLDYNYWSISQFDSLFEELTKSNLIIFKGDLNYRKLTGDLQWPKTTPFSEAIQDLKDSGLTILSLRTCKADVVVGLPEGLEERLVKEYKDEGNGNGQFWSSSGKWAVISFNK
ncbi:HRT2 [Candida oxycetoniae]|uniref:Sugar phosphate phosphatase n=1 Tax=Candida oxycetoniae TaxID=497107 RepID=A0AAI9WVW5_9ASCO|nr:HRT2 [Candida oxycetoniae]KAI3402616.1 HRT2 [Candida oxycetoniae]